MAAASAAASKPSAPIPRSRTSETRPSQRHALVLGWKGTAELIASALAEEGFTTTLERELPAGSRMPRPADPASLDAARAALARFASLAPKSAALYVHPGVSLWAERPMLQTLGQEVGLEVIGPSARSLTFFANRLNLMTEAEKAGIPHLVSSFEPIHSLREITQLVKSRRAKFPFLLKSVHGGGAGRFLIREDEDLERRLDLWMEQVRRQSGEVILFTERYVEGARYVVQPFARLNDGRFETFPSYDASLQSRYRKVLSFCPCESIDAEVAASIRDSSQRLADQVGFVGVGSFEFMVDGTRAYLVEGSARLDTNFHLWERVAGTSAVSWQLAAQESSSGPLPPRMPTVDAVSGIALRILAEDSLLQLPHPGRIHEVGLQRDWKFPGASAELTLGAESGEEILPSDSGLIGILWAWGRDATQAQTVARGVLEEVWIAGSLQTNERFLSELLNHPWVRAGLFHAGFVEEEFLPAIRPPEEILKILATLGPLAAEGQAARGPGIDRWSVGDQWVKPPAMPEWAEGPERFVASGEACLMDASSDFRRSRSARTAGRRGSATGTSPSVGSSSPRRPRPGESPSPRSSPSSRAAFTPFSSARGPPSLLTRPSS
jgi:3-methylcrotonyl-CoA carboxylase alpha subunit